MTRKPVLITVTPNDIGIPLLIVLASDGSMWASNVVTRDLTIDQWTPLRDLPQDKDA